MFAIFAIFAKFAIFDRFPESRQTLPGTKRGQNVGHGDSQPRPA
jgi:hypothetical protein